MSAEVNAPLPATIEARAATFDRSNMARVIEGMPGQIAFALTDPAFPDVDTSSISRVIVAGMGGSALPADVVADIFSHDLRAPIHIARHYTVPWVIDRSTLLVVTSFSGNTEETLAAFDQATETDARIVAIAAGGELADRATAANCPFIRIPREREPPGFQPRCALGYFATYMTRLLETAGLLTTGAATLERLIPFLQTIDVRGQAEETAQWLGQRVPIVYTDQTHADSIARITKIKLNENSKRPAFYNVLPEANHNEMIGLAGPFGEYGLLYLKDSLSHSRVHKRFETMRDLFSGRGLSHVQFKAWDLPGATNAERVFAGLMFADWWSYTLALLDGVDPTPVELVEEFKQQLRT
jgi:glucose/mannose-6-phosphate isomerase